MANLHLVTGYAGEAHVTAADDGSFNRAIFGAGQYVFDIGSKFAASVVSNNKITIADGDLLMQGRHVRLNEGTTVDLTITNGTQGKLRNDLIVARYTKDAVSGVEQVDLVVIQGTAVDSDPVDPAYTSGDIINDHDLLNDMLLYRVPLDGLNVGTPVALFELASVHISDDAVTTDKLGDGAVTTAKMADGAVTTEKLASDLLVPIANGGTGATTPAGAVANQFPTHYTSPAYIATLDGNWSGGWSRLSELKGALGVVSIKKLWQNASPSSAFYPQSLALDFSGCTHVLVLAYADTSHAYTVDVIGVPGVYAMATVAWGNTSTNSHRLFSFGSTSIWIDTGYSGSGTNNSTVIPYQIYGIKGVS